MGVHPSETLAGIMRRNEGLPADARILPLVFVDSTGRKTIDIYIGPDRDF